MAIFDPVHVNLRTTRYALHEMGFREMSCMSSMNELRKRLDEACPNLLIAEMSHQEAEVFDLVRSVRAGDVGDNPFIPILLTSWSRDGGTLKQAIGCGADDIIIRPFSTAFAEERIRTLVKGRKPFIVTSDYIGPDRRRDADREDDGAPPIDPPNTLKAIVENDTEALDQANASIAEAKRSVDAERLRRLCMRVIVGAEVGARELKAGRRPQMDLSDFERAASELKLRLGRVRSAEASRIAQALCQTATELQAEEGFTADRLGRAKELAMAVYAAYAGDEGIERSSQEIERTVEALRKRVVTAEPEDSSKDAADADSTEHDGGVEPDAGLKRAAS
ncbi:response regulator [Marinicauda salina]|uniref:response regulator n=1 Tax=Marinicauda salina TaxID=2135793 RepID=UPI001E65DEE1|nr:response regulator receiver protein [Marinicauda salina]